MYKLVIANMKLCDVSMTLYCCIGTNIVYFHDGEGEILRKEERSMNERVSPEDDEPDAHTEGDVGGPGPQDDDEDDDGTPKTFFGYCPGPGNEDDDGSE